jgi:uroporphyrinogen III methyltransferase/synthase
VSAPVAERRALGGRLIVVTRAREQSASLAGLLEAAGGRVLAVPTIAIESPQSWEPLDRALAGIADYDWLVFTSANGVAMVRRRLAGRGLGAEALAGPRVAAIGPATAAALARFGCRVDLTPAEYVAEALADGLRGRLAPGARVLLARAAEARDVLVRELEAMGARVDEVAAYRTRPAAEGAAALREALAAHRVDAVTFTSPSTVKHFAALFRPPELAQLMAGVVVAVIGPITRAAAAGAGLAPSVMPAEYTVPALARAIVDHFESGRS